MASDLDSLDDLLLSSESAVTRPKVSKFRPKLRPKSAKPPEAPKPLANADSSVVKPFDSSNSGDLVIDEATMTQQKALTEPLKSTEDSQQESVLVDDRTKGRGSEMMASDLDSLNDSILPSLSTEPTVGKFESKFCPKSAKPSEASTPLVNAVAFVVKPCNSLNSGALIVDGVRSTQDASTGSLKSAEAPLRETVQEDETLDGKVVGTRSSRLGSLHDIYFLPATMDSEPSLRPHRVGDHINLTEAPCLASETNKIHESEQIDQETEGHASDISNLESMDIFLSSAATVERTVGEVQQEKYAEGEYAPQVTPPVCASTDVFCGSPQINMYSEFHAIQDTETHPQSDGMKGNKVHVDSGNSGSEAMEESYRLEPLDAGFFSTENEHFEDHDATFQFESLPDSSVTWPGDSAFVHSSSREPLTQEHADFVQDPNLKDANIPGSYEDYIATPEISGKNNDGDGKSKFSTVNEDMDVDPPNEVHVAGFGEDFGNSKSRQLRKRTATHRRVNEPESGAYRDAEVEDEESSGSLFDGGDNNDDNDGYIVEEMPKQKRAPKKSKMPATENEKPAQRRRRSSKASDAGVEETQKKRFPHSTRRTRTRRQVDKFLLETPEDEIDTGKLMIRDLIMLGEAREKMSIKEAASIKKAFANMSGSANGDNDEMNPTDEPVVRKLNYHTYMNRTRSERWSKAETELFYQAVRQFGTDFAMIQQLFPNRTRNQVKLKFKKEDRQHPLQLADALSNRSKDHSHFQFVIERLKAQTEQNKDPESPALSIPVNKEDDNYIGEADPQSNENVGEESSYQNDGQEEVNANEEVFDWGDNIDWSQYDAS